MKNETTKTKKDLVPVKTELCFSSVVQATKYLQTYVSNQERGGVKAIHAGMVFLAGNGNNRELLQGFSGFTVRYIREILRISRKCLSAGFVPTLSLSFRRLQCLSRLEDGNFVKALLIEGVALSPTEADLRKCLRAEGLLPTLKDRKPKEKPLGELLAEQKALQEEIHRRKAQVLNNLEKQVPTQEKVTA